MKKILHIVSWIPLAFIKLALLIIGLVTVPLYLLFKGPKLLWIWGNDEEGSEPKWWMDFCAKQDWKVEEGFAKKFVAFMRNTFPRFWWLAVRNPVNNTRFIFKDRSFPTIETDTSGGMEAHNLVANGRTSAYRWAYSGPFAGYRKVWLTEPGKYSEIWFGWKIGSSVPGMGFTTQVRRNRKIGT